MLTAIRYIRLINQAMSEGWNEEQGKFAPSFYEASDAIDLMSHADRINLRVELANLGENRILHNLSYDYQNQCWITAVNLKAGL